MPHVIVKLWPGKSEQQNRKLVDGVTKLVQSNGVRCGFCFKPLLHVLQFGS